MIKSYLKSALRNVVRNKGYSAINIAGLAAGLFVAILISLWLWDEVTFDTYHNNYQKLGRVMTTFVNNDGLKNTENAVCMPIGEELRTRYGSDFKHVSMATWNFEHILGVGDKKIAERGMWVESAFPSMFSLNMIKGNRNALDDPSSVLISASVAKALFGDDNALGKTVRFNNRYDFKVAGVFEDLPQNTSLRDVKLLLPWKKYITTQPWLQEAATQWNNHSWQCFVEMNEPVNADNLTAKIKDVVMVHKNAATEGVEQALVHPMKKWHLYGEFTDGEAQSGRIQFVWLFATIGVFVLMLACINFMNLSTARSQKRAKEVGIRKTIGSAKSQLVVQFLIESVLVAFLSLALALMLVALLLPAFNMLAEKTIRFPWNNGIFWLLVIAFTLVTGLISGSYPALYLSGFKPINVLKGTFAVGRYASLPRKILVVLQFTFSIALIIGTIVVYKQIQYANSRPVNYEKAGLITIEMKTPDLYGHYEALRTDLIATGVVENMAQSSSPTTAIYANQIGFDWRGKDPNSLPAFGTIGVSTDFGKTIGWKIEEGRDFSKEFSTDSTGMIVNEAAVKLINMKRNIVGEIIQFNDQNYTVIGVVKDMVMESPYEPVTPVVFLCDSGGGGVITIKLKPYADVRAALAKVESVFKKHDPASPFSYTFNDEQYAQKFADEQRIARLATFFTILAIFISCLGLFGLASFVAEQRKKEIGVRKVLGATVFGLWQMLSKDFVMLVTLSFVIAVPLASYVLHKWLERYTYRTDIPWWIFILTGGTALLITLLTVSFQAIKAAVANPVKSLKAE